MRKKRRDRGKKIVKEDKILQNFGTARRQNAQVRAQPAKVLSFSQIHTNGLFLKLKTTHFFSKCLLSDKPGIRQTKLIISVLAFGW